MCVCLFACFLSFVCFVVCLICFCFFVFHLFCLFVCLFVCLLACLFACFVRLFVCLFLFDCSVIVCLSVCLDVLCCELTCFFSVSAWFLPHCSAGLFRVFVSFVRLGKVCFRTSVLNQNLASINGGSVVFAVPENKSVNNHVNKSSFLVGLALNRKSP